MNTNVKYKEVSDIDGISPASSECGYCKLNVHNEFMKKKLCQNCYQLTILYQLNKLFGKLLLPSIFISILFLITPSLKGSAIIFPLVVFVPIFFLSTFQKQLHFFKLEKRYKIIPLLRMHKKLNDFSYYSSALDIWRNHYSDMNEAIRYKVFNELFEDVIHSPKPNPHTWIDDWREPTGMNAEQFIDYLWENVDFLKAFDIAHGTGTLPDVWGLIKDDEKKEKILNRISENIDKMNDFTEIEKKLYLEDLYLIDDQIEEFIEENGKYQNILEAIEQFVPDEPPRSMREELIKSAQERAKMDEISG